MSCFFTLFRKQHHHEASKNTPHLCMSLGRKSETFCFSVGFKPVSHFEGKHLLNISEIMDRIPCSLNEEQCYGQK